MPCLHHIFVRGRKLISIIARLTIDILVCAVLMFDSVDNTITKTISHLRNFSSPMLQLLKSCLPYTELTVQASTWDEYLDGWHSGNSVLQLMIKTFLGVHTQRGRWKLPWQWLAWEERYCQRWAGLQYFHLPSSLPTVYQLLRVPTLMHRRTGTSSPCLLGCGHAYLCSCTSHLSTLHLDSVFCYYFVGIHTFYMPTLSLVLFFFIPLGRLGILGHGPGLPWFTAMVGPYSHIRE